MLAPATGLAPAKVNLFLHVGPVEADGYHPLASLVAFADLGDRVTIATADRLSLTVTGPFGDTLSGEGDNLILRALRAFGAALGTGEPALAVTLDKQLPIAAGLGGGSSDAGAALRLARDRLAPGFGDDALAGVAARIGADGPMCLFARSAWAGGRGDVLTPEPRLPSLPAILVNPGAPSPTGPVYRAYDADPHGDARMPAPPPDWAVEGVIDWLAERRNDLESPAVGLAPVIGEALEAVRATGGVDLARMSGSGATVFGLCRTPAAADAAVADLQSRHPGWWIKSTALGHPKATAQL